MLIYYSHTKISQPLNENGTKAVNKTKFTLRQQCQIKASENVPRSRRWHFGCCPDLTQRSQVQRRVKEEEEEERPPLEEQADNEKRHSRAFSERSSEPAEEDKAF